jgi:hypothetical protein
MSDHYINAAPHAKPQKMVVCKFFMTSGMAAWRSQMTIGNMGPNEQIPGL